MTTPAGRLQRTWFYVSLYWCGRGREGQRDLRRDSFKFTRDASGREYAVMTHEEATENHPGGENSKSSAERETRLYSTGENDAFSSSMLRIMTSLCVSFVRMCSKPLFEHYCYVNEDRLYNIERIPRAPSSFFVQLEAGKLL